MKFLADLHIHSKYSMATSKDADLEHLAIYGLRKGLGVIATGDFTHPVWFEELKEKLVPAEEGLFRLRDDLDREARRLVPASCAAAPLRFMLSVEISTIYKRDGKTRKVHHVIYAPDFQQADALRTALGRMGNLASDGRPILGLDSRDLLETALESGPGVFLIPAHIWTPWFSAMGSKSGFDSVADCYADLAGHIFAVETGLSSDPAMNWRVPSLDRYRLVSNSDAHSPAMLGREANAFDCPLEYGAIRRALATGDGLKGTVEFFPEEGKYHLDGHRNCGMRLTPAQTKELGGRCPKCGGIITVGVESRVEDLATRPEGYRPPGAAGFESIIPLPEIVAEVEQVGVQSKKVKAAVESLTSRLGSEMSILREIPLEDIRHQGSPVLAEAIGRLRAGKVHRTAGFDGQFGVIRLFQDHELFGHGRAPLLFPLEPPRPSEDWVPPVRPAQEAASQAPLKPEEAVEGYPSGEGKGPEAGREGENPASSAADVASTPSAAVAKGSEGKDGNGESGDAFPDRSPVSGAPSPARPSSPPRSPWDAGRRRERRDLLAGLSEEQREAVLCVEGPLLVVAGPGTGKTRTLTTRLAHLVADEGADPSRCLCVTFSRKAAEEMRTRLESLAPGAAPRMMVETFHAFALKILREEPAAAGLPPGFRILDEEGPEGKRQLVSDVFQVNSSEAGRLCESFRRDPSSFEAVRFRQEMASRGAVDLDSVIPLAVHLLESRQDVAARWRERLDHVSIDEFQDVDAMQYRLASLVSLGAESLCAIGDPDQAIYAFRGGDLSFFLRFAEDHPGTRKVRLSLNYRSSPAIVEAATAAIAPQTLVAGRPLSASRDGEGLSGQVTLALATDARDEADFIARRIEEAVGGTSHRSFDVSPDMGHADRKDRSFSDFAILYRTDAQATALMEALSRRSIPFQKSGHLRLAAHRGVRFFRDLLRHQGTEGLLGGDGGEGCILKSLLAGARQGTEVRPDGREDPLVAEALEMLRPLASRCQGLDDFLAAVEQGAEVDAMDFRAERVSLLTMHAAKGLEFPVVFLAGCDEGLIPFRPRFERLDEAALAEERRLFFVAMTRARDELVLTRAARRSLLSEESETRPSSFLDAIPPQLVQRLDLAAQRAEKKRRVRQLKLF